MIVLCNLQESNQSWTVWVVGCVAGRGFCKNNALFCDVPVMWVYFLHRCAELSQRLSMCKSNLDQMNDYVQGLNHGIDRTAFGGAITALAAPINTSIDSFDTSMSKISSILVQSSQVWQLIVLAFFTITKLMLNSGPDKSSSNRGWFCDCLGAGNHFCNMCSVWAAPIHFLLLVDELLSGRGQRNCIFCSVRCICAHNAAVWRSLLWDSKNRGVSARNSELEGNFVLFNSLWLVAHYLCDLQIINWAGFNNYSTDLAFDILSSRSRRSLDFYFCVLNYWLNLSRKWLD